MRSTTFARGALCAVAPLLLHATAPLSAQNRAQQPTRTVDSTVCDADSGGLRLPRGFCAKVIAQGPASFRHIVVTPNGDIFAGSQGDGGGLYALRDGDGDGEFEIIERLWERSGNGVALRGEQLYFATNDAILRFRVPAGAIRPVGAPDTLVFGLPDTQSHTAKSIALGSGDELYVNIGSPGNVCQLGREQHAASQDPCPELEQRAGVWRFSTERLRQRQQDGVRFATGIRNAVALTTHPETSELYAVVHGRDNLFQAWPEYFNAATSAELPAEEFIHITEGDDFGWPYCFYDRFEDVKVLAPEYGGDGVQVGRCADRKDPLVGFPGHWGPNGIVFYDGEQFPERYRGAAFIAFHGSWNRAPLPQAGYNIAVQRITEEGIALGWEIFADEFQGVGARPVGVAVGPDGSLYISSDSGQRIWRVRHVGTEPADGGG